MGWDGFLKWHILFALRSELKKNEEFAQAMADEVWLTEKQLVEEMPFFKKSWVKHKYYKLCYRQVIVTDKDGNEFEVPADTVLYAVGSIPNSAVVDELREWPDWESFRAIGDCTGAGIVKKAIHQGYFAAMDIL